MIVYVDVLLVLNFIVNYLLLLISARLQATNFSRPRLVLASLFGSVCSLSIFLPPMGSAANIMFKILLSGALVLLAGGYVDLRSYFKRLLMLLVASFVFAGFMLFIVMLSGGKNSMVFFQNGVCYFNISAVKLLTCSVIAYAILILYQKIFKKSMAGEEEYTVIITVQGKTIEMTGVMDSQNHLVDLFSGTPVVIGSYTALSEILPVGVKKVLCATQTAPVAVHGVRLIPCRTVAGQDVLPAFRPDRMVLRHGKKDVAVDDVYIAVAASLDSTGTQKLILNPAMAGREMQSNQKGGACKR